MDDTDLYKHNDERNGQWPQACQKQRGSLVKNEGQGRLWPIRF